MPPSGRDRRIPAAHVGEVEPAPPSCQTEFHVVRHDLLPSGDEWAVLRRSTIMKFDVDAASRPRRIAKALQAALGRRGIPVPLHTCQSLVARMYGHDDWHGLTHARSDDGPSPFDEDVDAATVAARREHQIHVLTGGALPEAIAVEVIDEIRPTASGRQRRPTLLPRIRVMGCRTSDDDGSIVEIGEQDVTRRMVEYIKAYGFETAMERIAHPHTAAVLLRDDLTPAAYEQFYSRSFHLDGLPAAVEAFVAEVGSADHMTMSIFSSRLDRLNRWKWNVTAIEAAVADISVASLRPDRASDDMFYRPSPFSSYDDYVGEPYEAYDGWAYDEFRVLETPPAHGTPAYGVWLGRLAEWSRVNAPPVVFGTFPEHWTGVREDDVREALADLTDIGDDASQTRDENGELDRKLASEVIEQILASLQDHHEDAGEEIVDLDAIEPILVEWHPHAGTGDEIDLGLKTRLAEWNARQTIVSYYPDMSVIVPARPDVTQADVDRWTASAVRLATERMEACDRWERVKPKPSTKSVREPKPDPVGEERVEVVLSAPRP